MSSEWLQQVFHTGDQRLLNVFQEMSLADPIEREKESGEKWGLQHLEASIAPKNIPLADYDWVLSLKDPAHDGFLGLIANDL